MKKLKLSLSNKILIIFILILISSFFLVGCTEQSQEEATTMAELKITSPVFKNKDMIPKKYTCQGADINPELNIEGIPSNAKSLALIVDDPDAPGETWVHWVVWNIPIVSKIAENSIPKGAVQGLNDFNKHDYGGPCPPSGTHRYFFKLYAIDTTLSLSSNARKEDLEKAMQGHILAETKLVGLYKKE